MVYQPASVLSRDVDVALVTKGQCSIWEDDEKQKLLWPDTIIEQPNIRSSKQKSFIVSDVLIVVQTLRELFVLFILNTVGLGGGGGGDFCPRVLYICCFLS